MRKLRILLLGDYSALHKYLYSGLKKNGYEVDWASTGDGYKMTGQGNMRLYDGELLSTRSFGNAFRLLFQILHGIQYFKNYDIVQIICPHIYPKIINALLLRRIRRENGKLVLLGAGIDLANVRAWRNNRFRYYPYDFDASLCKRFEGYKISSILERLNDKLVVKNVDMIIPTAYSYYVGYENNNKTTNTIQMPVDCSSVQYCPNIVKEKIVIFHGVSIGRENEKGSPIIIEALKRLEKNYPERVTIELVGGISLSEYLCKMKSANIFIDQCTGGGYGMGGLQAMAMGKVLCADLWDEFLNIYGIDSKEFPGIVIKPETEYIYKQLENVILHENNWFEQQGRNSRAYVEKFHSDLIVADKYIAEWSKTK